MSVVAAAVIGSAVVGGVVSSKASKNATQAQDRATDANAYQGEIATDQYDYYKGTYRPLETSLVAEATAAGSQAEYDKAAADAQSTVSTQLGLAADRLRRTPGLDPSSAASAAANTNLALKGAAMGAGAQNAAREQVKDKAYAKKMDAVGLGKGLVTNAMNGLSSAAATAQSAANAQNAQAASTASSVGGAASTAITALANKNWGLTGYQPQGNYTGTGSSWVDNYTPSTAPVTIDPSVGAVMPSI